MAGAAGVCSSAAALCAQATTPCAFFPLLQRVFKLPQADWMRDEEYEVVVSATNAFCESGNSTEEEFETPL